MKARTKVKYKGVDHEVINGTWNIKFARRIPGTDDIEWLVGACLLHPEFRGIPKWISMKEIEKENPTEDANPEWGDYSP